MSHILMLLALLLTLTRTASCSLSCAGFWEDVKRDIMSGKQKEFQQTISLLTQFTKVTYTWRLETEIPDWQLVSNRSSECGLHALTYRKTNNPKLAVIAIRGTQLGTSNGSLCDICASAYLLGDQGKYEFCKQFPERSINYFQQANDYTTEVMNELDVDCLGFTGHSLGAALSELMSVQYEGRFPAIVFASYGIRAATKRFGLKPHFGNLLNLYSEYDPIAVLPKSWNNQTGTGCKFADGPLPEYCEACFRNPSFDVTNLTSDCGLCFLDKHIYKHYLNMIFVDKKTPTCSPFLHSNIYVPYSSVGSKLQSWPVSLPKEVFLFVYIVFNSFQRYAVPLF